jgi:spore germination cell wall hydrolase CwlJ-like protein
MLISLRSALFTCAALTIASIAPAQAEQAVEPLLPITSADLPQVAVPELRTDESEPLLSAPEAIEEQAAETAAPARPSGNLATMVADLRGSEPGSRELECLATGIYFESKSEPLSGQLAVGKVIANRANSGGRFPSSYCGVLFQPGQFSFIRGGKLPAVPRSSKQWQTAVGVAKVVDQQLHASPVGKALFFHARYVSPRWRLTRVAAVGNHIFYR